VALVRYAGVMALLLALVVGPWWPSYGQRVTTCLDRGGFAVATTYQQLGVRHTVMSCVDQDGNTI
jgi:hypothetical protein